jgi:hypothetical protein
MDVNANFNVDINKILIYLPQTISTSIAATGGLGLIYIAPPTGKLCTVNSMYINIPAVSGATSGTHSLVIAAGTTNAGAMITITADYNHPIVIQGVSPAGYYALINVNTPSDISAFVTALLNLMFNNELRLYFRYINNTDAAQTASRIYNVMYVTEGENISF